MIFLVEELKLIKIEGEEWECVLEWMDKNFIFKYDSFYYLSWGWDYVIVIDVYGLYICQGVVGEGYGLSFYVYGSFFWWKGQFYYIWCYYIWLGFKYWEFIIIYCYFDDDG